MVEIILEKVTMPSNSRERRFQKTCINNKWEVIDTGDNSTKYKGNFEDATLICHNLNKKYYRDGFI